MHARTWLAWSCAAITVIAGAACNNKGNSPVAPDDFSPGSSFNANPEDNSPPVITSLTAAPPSILLSETATLTARVTDADGDSVSCTWSLGSGGEITPGSKTCTAVLRPTQARTLRVSVQARDSRGATSAARSVEVAVGITARPTPPHADPEPDPGPKPRPNPSPSPTPDPNPSPSPTPIPPPTVNHAPVVSIVADPASCAAPCTVTVKATASDPDDDPVTLTFGGCASGTVQSAHAESKCELLNFAEVIATVKASDPSGATAQASVVIEGQPSPNHPPTVTLRTSGEACHPRPGLPCHITFTAQAIDIDPGDSVTYVWSGCTSGSAATADCVVSSPDKFVGSVSVRDRAGATASASVQVLGANHAPDGSASAEAIGCHPYPSACQVDVSATGSDADGDVLSYTWSGCAGADGTAATCTVPALATQPQTAKVEISDGWTSVTRSVLISALNRQPNVEASGGSTCHPRPGQPCTVPVAAVASDPDGDPLTLTWFDCATGTGSRGTCRIETLGPTLATATARDVFGAQRLATAISYGVNQAAHAIASPQTGSGASATYTLSWSDDDGDRVTCQLTSSDVRCQWGSCNVGGSSNGTRQCQVKVDPTARPGFTCQLRLSCRDVWNQGNDAVLTHTY